MRHRVHLSLVHRENIDEGILEQLEVLDAQLLAKQFESLCELTSGDVESDTLRVLLEGLSDRIGSMAWRNEDAIVSEISLLLLFRTFVKASKVLVNINVDLILPDIVIHGLKSCLLDLSLDFLLVRRGSIFLRGLAREDVSHLLVGRVVFLGIEEHIVVFLHFLLLLHEHFDSSLSLLCSHVDHRPVGLGEAIVILQDGAARQQGLACARESFGLLEDALVVVLFRFDESVLQSLGKLFKTMRLSRHVSKGYLSVRSKDLHLLTDVSEESRGVEPEHWIVHSLGQLVHLGQLSGASGSGVEEVELIE
mmetsp:Transcript_33362/g.51154  ORF Transcript_33362/g.51154 Transcript_33362/m.51154 type:complete len:307 (+) Transcript_33362:808-1728(+)